MRVISFVQQKGGCGRTTLALNLSVVAETRSERVLVVDLDPQHSCGFWAETRGSDRPTVIGTTVDRLPDIVSAAREMGQGGPTLLMIDTPSGLDDVTLAAIRAGDMIISPTVPNLMNLGSLRDTVALIDDAGKLRSTVAVINNVDESDAPRRIDHAKGVLIASFQLVVARTAVFHLPQFGRAFDEGKAVTELRPAGSKAATQIETLYGDLDKLARRICVPALNIHSDHGRMLQ